MTDNLLTRDDFRERTFSRDNHKCVICGSPGQDAHHILERRLWGDGGYYLDNGATLCGGCHLKAESTEIDAQRIRDAAGIEKVILPNHLYKDNVYDKWGNVILPNGQRLRGDMFYDENVQKTISPVKHLFSNYVKYARTYHLPFSESKTNDDRTLGDCSQFEGKEVVVTEKMDGENTSIYRNYVHARSIESDSHPSRAWVKNFAADIGWELPEGWRLCGENLYAKHSIYYDNLKSYFYLFSIWDEKNRCMPWDEMTEYAEMLGLEVVPVLWRGVWDEEKVRQLAKELDTNKQEGFTVRLASGFSYGSFRRSIAKYVRKNHVAENAHNWKTQAVVPNKLAY